MQIRTGTARSGDVDIYYEDMGEPTDPAVLLIMGLGSQLLLWRDGFCEKLVAEGLRVIRYDNRDVGLSSKTERRGNGGATIPSMLKFWLGIPGQA
ncbi:MAG TPA: alpha/beta hydrolase, partial [Mycobacterium sp.]